MITSYGPMWGKACQLRGEYWKDTQVRAFMLGSFVLLARRDRRVQADGMCSTPPERVCRVGSRPVTSKTSTRAANCKPQDWCSQRIDETGKCQECHMCLEALRAEVSPGAQKPVPQAWGGSRQHASIVSTALLAVNRSWLLLNSGICFLEKNN